MTTGNKIRHLRKAAKLTQTELGEKLGVKTNAVSKWECGRVYDIPASKIKAMAQLFDVPVSYLIDDEDPGTTEAIYYRAPGLHMPRKEVLQEGHALFPDFTVIGFDGKSRKYNVHDSHIEKMWELLDMVFSIPPNKIDAACQMLTVLKSVE